MTFTAAYVQCCMRKIIVDRKYVLAEAPLAKKWAERVVGTTNDASKK